MAVSSAISWASNATSSNWASLKVEKVAVRPCMAAMKDLPPKSSVYDYFDLWAYDGTLPRIHHALYERCREQAQREASPTAAIIDSQSVKSAEKGGACIDPHGYDAGKKIKGKKRHILVDTLYRSQIGLNRIRPWRAVFG